MGRPTVLAETLARSLRAHSDRPAVSDGKETWTYRRLDQEADVWAGHLGALAGRSGPDPRRVGIYAGNSPSYVAAYVGALRSGCVPFLLDRAFGASEFAHVETVCGVDSVVHDREIPGEGDLDAPLATQGPLRLSSLGPATDAVPQPLDATTEVCRFTSGSTGRPSCLEFSGPAVLAAGRNWAQATGLGRDDRILCYAGLSNGLAFNTSLLSAFLVGASLWLPSGLPSGGNVERLAARWRATRLVGFPALVESMTRRSSPPPPLPDLALVISSGAPLRREVADRFRHRYGIGVCNYYGVAECGPVTVDARMPEAPGVGLPLPGVDLRISPHDDVADSRSGAVGVRTPSMATRYLDSQGGLESRLDADGFLDTGDVGYVEDGRLHLTGRLGTTLNVAGRKIDPVEVRDALLEVAGVEDAAVLVVEKSNGDPCLAAAVVGSVGLTAEAVRRHCAATHAMFKVPELVRVVESLPLNSIGKPQMDRMRALFSEV